MKQWLWLVSVAVLLGACSSPVKLDNVPVEDKSGAAVSGQGATAKTDVGSGVGVGATPVAKGGVTTVDVSRGASDAAIQSLTRTIFFDYDSFMVRAEFQLVLESHARYIKADKGRKVTIEGHTDERGGREYNLALGQKRSEAVRRALALLGVPETQLEAVSFGKEKPAVEGSSEAAMEKNRRAEISYR